MTALLTKSQRLSLGIDTIERSIVYALLALRQVNDDGANKEAVQVTLTANAATNTINATLSGQAKLYYSSPTALTGGFNLLEAITPYGAETPDLFQDFDPSVGLEEEIPEEPVTVETLEQFLLWCALILSASTHPLSLNYVKFSVFESADPPNLSIAFSLPLDYGKFLLTGNWIESVRKVFGWHITDPDQLISPFTIPPSQQFWGDPVDDLTALSALTGQAVGNTRWVHSEEAFYSLLAELPVGETFDGAIYVAGEADTVWRIGGVKGDPGLSAYQVAVAQGFQGTAQAWLNSLVGDAGDPGLSAYQVAVANGFQGTAQDWLNSLVGDAGGHVIQNEGAPMPQRANLNFKGFKFDDSPGADSTIIQIADTLTDKALYYYDATSKLFKPIAIGTDGQALIAKPAAAPPFQFATLAAPGGGREVLTADRTYYVRTDGSDSNNGLANTAGGAFLNLQKAVDVVCSLDCSIYIPTIQLGNGTYTLSSPLELKRFLGTKAVIKGNSTTPSNVILQGPGDVIRGIGTKGSLWELKDFKLQSSTSSASARALIFLSNADIDIYNLDYGAMAGGSYSSRQINATKNSLVRVMSSYAISGGANMHVLVETGALMDFRDAEPTAPVTVTLTGTPAFSNGAFLWVASMGKFNCLAGGAGLSFSGSATATRYAAYYNSLILTNGGGATFLPGNANGSPDATSVYA